MAHINLKNLNFNYIDLELCAENSQGKKACKTPTIMRSTRDDIMTIIQPCIIQTADREITAQKDKQGRDGLDIIQESFGYLQTISKYENKFR